jgi:hypothetical protein
MSYNVHLHVCFPCDSNEGVAALARTHLAALDPAPLRGGRHYAHYYLQHLAERTGFNHGPKGGLSLWGMVGNGGGMAGEFVEGLQPFWTDLLSMDGDEGGPDSFEHVLVFHQGEDEDAANAYEVCWDNHDLPDRQLLIKHHQRLPFSWRF